MQVLEGVPTARDLLRPGESIDLVRLFETCPDEGVLAQVAAARMLAAHDLVGEGGVLNATKFDEVLDKAGFVGFTKHYAERLRILMKVVAGLLDWERVGRQVVYTLTPTDEVKLLARVGTPAPDGVKSEPEEEADLSLAEVGRRLADMVHGATLVHYLNWVRVEFGTGMLRPLYYMLLEAVDRSLSPEDVIAQLAILLGEAVPHEEAAPTQ